jgi:hypothetical protein
MLTVQNSLIKVINRTYPVENVETARTPNDETDNDHNYNNVVGEILGTGIRSNVLYYAPEMCSSIGRFLNTYLVAAFAMDAD